MVSILRIMNKYIFFEKNGVISYTVINEKSIDVLNKIENRYENVIIKEEFPSTIYIEFFKAYYIHESEIKLNINIAKEIYSSKLNKEISNIKSRLDELEFRYIMESDKLEKITNVKQELDNLTNTLDLSNINTINELIKVRPTILDIYEELLH